tara:strand:+ start:110 stop:655 length:546 start_codon:yes stop_codon:yes gene_type:complete
MNKFLLILLLPLMLIVEAKTDYIYGQYRTGTAEPEDADYEMDITGGIIGYASGNGNFVFQTSASWGTADLSGLEVDFSGFNVAGGYAFNDIADGSFVVGISYGEVILVDPFGGDDFETTNTDPYIGYGKMSGDGMDYLLSISDGVISGTTYIPFTENLSGQLSFSNDDEVNAFGVGLAFKY